MNCQSPAANNPVERFVACFDTVKEAALAADVSTEMLRRMRARGFVTTRDRALIMAKACKNKVRAVDLLGLRGEGRAH